MINFFSNTWSTFTNWSDDSDNAFSGLSNERYYLKNRAVLIGLPIALISSVAASYMFKCTTHLTATAFGAFNYVILTTLIEIIRKSRDIEKGEALELIGLTGAVSFGFFRMVCNTSLTSKAASILTLASLTGTVARHFFVDEE